jgi:hypothetical protein
MKTAIETLLEDMKEHQINVDFPNTFQVLCKYALEMEKEMIEHAFNSGKKECYQHITAEEYFIRKHKNEIK